MEKSIDKKSGIDEVQKLFLSFEVDFEKKGLKKSPIASNFYGETGSSQRPPAARKTKRRKSINLIDFGEDKEPEVSTTDSNEKPEEYPKASNSSDTENSNENDFSTKRSSSEKEIYHILQRMRSLHHIT